MKTTGKPGVFRRDGPDLPTTFDSGREPGTWFEDEGIVTIQDERLQDLERTGLRRSAFQLEGCVLERVQLPGGEFGSVVWKDVRLVGCDLSNVRAHRMTLVRVEFVDCRLTGLASRGVDWRDVLIQGGEARYAQLAGGKFLSCEFEKCDWREADLQGADVAGSVFRSCNLGRADLRGGKLMGTDFRKSELEGMVVGMGDLRGAVVDPGQAMVLAQVLGLVIR